MHPKDLIPVRNADGTISLVDPYQGIEVARQASHSDLLRRRSETMVAITHGDGTTTWLDRNLDPGILGATGRREWAFSETLVEIICERIRQGDSLAKICKDPGMPPYAVVCRWRREKKDVDLAIAQAREDRAETLKDIALTVAEDAVAAADEETQVSARKLQIDTLKWVAGADSPKRFGPPAKKESISVGNAVIMIDTGIKRDVQGVVNGSQGNPEIHTLIDTSHSVRGDTTAPIGVVSGSGDGPSGGTDG